jgi:aminopeptidase N
MRFLIVLLSMTVASFSQTPPIEPGVPHELAKWRAAQYSDVRYKLDLTLEKMSPVLKGAIEIRLNVRDAAPIILDWRKIRGFEDRSTLSNVSINGTTNKFEESNEHLIFRDGVKAGENLIKLDFTSPILPSGSAVTRYIDKEDGSEYIYSLFVPSDASTAFPVFDQPDLKARFTLELTLPTRWLAVSNTSSSCSPWNETRPTADLPRYKLEQLALLENKRKDLSKEMYAEIERCIQMHPDQGTGYTSFPETKPISTYVFAFAAGPWERVTPGAVSTTGGNPSGSEGVNPKSKIQNRKSEDTSSIYVRRSQLAKLQPHAAEVFRLNREAVKYFEEYFDYKFPFPKYDLVLIPEFPFGGMEHAGATFLRESAIIFPSEPTKNDIASRATLIFHEAAHQWFGDTVTMRWFDDLWLKEGFATFTAYKAMERIMPEMNAWKIFYERIKQGAYQTDSTRGTTAIYQPIPNLSAAKSAYGNIVYNKAPAFLRQAEFDLGEEKFRNAVRSFLKKNEFGNAGWEDLVKEFEAFSGEPFDDMSEAWIKQSGMWKVRTHEGRITNRPDQFYLTGQTEHTLSPNSEQSMTYRVLIIGCDGSRTVQGYSLSPRRVSISNQIALTRSPCAVFPNYQDYGYGIFLLDDKSRNYVLKNIQNEKDPFLRSMMWGALWDSVREGELDPKEYVQLAIRNLPLEKDESISASVLGRVGTAVSYYLGEEAKLALAPPLEMMLESEMLKADSLGRRITFYRSFLGIGASIGARETYKKILNGKFWPKPQEVNGLIIGATRDIPLKTKDRFDIVTRLLVLGDPEAPKLLADLEQKETSDDAKRYAYAAKAGMPSAENKARFWNDFVNNKQISESWIEAAFGPFNSIRHADLTRPYLERALRELPNHKRNRKIFFVNGWLGAFIGGQRSEEALAIVNKFLADNPQLDRDLRLKILENVDVIERAVKIRGKYASRPREL